MSYSVNPLVFKSVFAVPADIVDKHIRIANGEQLKVILWMCRNSSERFELEKMCKELKMNIEDAKDYIQYWMNAGVVEDSEIFDKIHETEKPKLFVPSTGTPKPEATVPPSKPSSEEIIQRIDESPEIGHLFNEAQKKLGKTIGYDGQCTLLLLHDHYGLPVEVLFMLIDYCVSVGKTNYGYIETVGRDWGTKEIDTLEKAAMQISSLSNANSFWKSFAIYAGLNNSRPTPKQADYVRKWLEEWNFGEEIIFHAYDEMATNTGKFSMNYMDKVLLNWHNSGFTSVSDIEHNEQKRTKMKKSNTHSVTSGTTASYDIEKFKETALHGKLKYERKKTE